MRLFTLLLPVMAVVSLMATDTDYQQFDSRAMLGVNMTPPSTATQTANSTDPATGVEAQTVYPGTAAERMGVQPGDLITSVNGGVITSMNDLRNEVALTGVGGQATVTVLRNGQQLTFTDTLNEWPKTIPYEPIDETAERRFRDWQSRRLDRTQQAVGSLRKQVEDVERRTESKERNKKKLSGPLSPAQALALPASEALDALPPFRLRVHHRIDTADSGRVQPGRQVSWDARVLLGSPAPDLL